MRVPRSGVVAGALVWALAACAPPPEPSVLDGIVPFLDSVRVAHGVPGASFAAFDHSGIVLAHTSGVKSSEADDPVAAETVFEAASISKPVFAYIVLSLVQQGVLDLDTPLADLVPEVPAVGYDPRAERLTPRILLTHQGGLPNWRSRLSFEARTHEELFAPDDTLRFVAEPGAGYRYSGEGYVLLQRVVEELTGAMLPELAQAIVFDPLGMARTSFVFDERARRDHSQGHNRDGDPDKWFIQMPLAATTLHTTAADLARFGVHLAAEIRGGGPFSELAIPGVEPLVDGGMVRSWGPGLGIVDAGSRRYVYHGGNNVIFLADFIYGVDEDLGYVLLTNSANGAAMIEAVERRVYGVDLPR